MFLQIYRNHNTDNGIDQDPVSLGSKVVESAKDALTLRYSLLPYLYSLFVKSHLYGHPVVTPTFFHAHPGDRLAYGIDWQFFWGSGLLIVPVLQENTLQVEAYLPSGIWYVLIRLFRLFEKFHAGRLIGSLVYVQSYTTYRQSMILPYFK